MSQKSVELILFRQLSSYLATPVFIVDLSGNLIFCNEPAEKILGFRFSETGEMPADEWSTIFAPQDKQGRAIEKEKLPLYISFTELSLNQNKFYIKSLDNVLHYIDIVTIPIINHAGIVYGAVAFFKEIT